MMWVVFFVAMGIPLWGLAFFEYFTYLSRKRAAIEQKRHEAEVDKFWATYEAEAQARKEQEEKELREKHYQAQEAMAKTLYAPVMMTKLAEPEYDPRTAARMEAEARIS